VAGMPDWLATDILVELVRLLAEGAADGRTFQRNQAAKLLRENWQLEGKSLDNVMQALGRMPGVEHPEYGDWRLPEGKPQVWAKHRLWRYPLRLNPAEAVALYSLLAEGEKQGALPRGLSRQGRRMGAALKAIFRGMIRPWPKGGRP